MSINIPYPVIDMKKTGANIKKIREEHGYSVTDIQKFLGLASPQAIYQWQQGINLPTVDHLCALSMLFGLSMNDFLILAEPVDNNRSNVVRMKRFPAMTKMLLRVA